MLTEFSSSDCDELSESLSNTEQMFRQVRSGHFAGQWRLLELPGVSIVDDRISHGIYNSVMIRGGFAVAFIPVRQQGTLVFEGHRWDHKCIFLGKPESQPILTIPSDFRSYTVEFSLECLRRTATVLGVSLPERVADIEIVSNSAAWSAARELVADAYCTAGDCSRLNPQQRTDRFVTGWLNLLRQILGQPQSMDRSTLAQRRRAALEVANFIRTHLRDDLSLADLCEVAGVTDRTLRTGFQEVFGMSPMRWLKVERLCAARRELKAADPKRDQVRTIASKYGFVQFAHFATDYRKQFGESPSETLRR